MYSPRSRVRFWEQEGQSRRPDLGVKDAATEGVPAGLRPAVTRGAEVLRFASGIRTPDSGYTSPLWKQ
jgi:hypothetical protein